MIKTFLSQFYRLILDTHEADLEHSRPAVMLHGFDMEKWHYLGWTEPRYTALKKPHKELASAYVHYFENKETGARDFYLDRRNHTTSYGHNFDHHPWLAVYSAQWKAKELKHWAIVKKPSKYLIALMKEEGYTDTYPNGIGDVVWQPISEYDKAVEKNKKPKPVPAVTDEGNNVVKLDFTKKDNNETQT